jgi:type I restriction enzyme S subunit
VRFGDVVRNVNETVNSNELLNFEKVIGLEHLDPGELKVSRWAEMNSLSDGTTFRRIFRPGQVLFGKRRAYQRKVALASFEGICSSDILVFDSKSERLLSEFLPYIVQSDAFFEHALQTSSGSLSPRTRWEDLSNFEFELPSLEQQERVVEMLTTIDDHLGHLTLEQGLLRKMQKVYVSDWLLKVGPFSSSASIADVCQTGLFCDGDWVESKDQDPHGSNRLVQLADIGEGCFLDKSRRYLNDDQFQRLRCTSLREGDVLVARMPEPIARACLYVDLGQRAATVVDISIARCDQSIILPQVLVSIINDEAFRSVAKGLTTGTTRPRIARSKLGAIVFPLPPMELQLEFVKDFGRFSVALSDLDEARSASEILRTALINSEIE